jgi:hypothetical protein
MRQWVDAGLIIVLAAGLVAGCGGGTSSSGFFEVALTDEKLETVQGNQCAVKGHATNVGNLRAKVDLTYEALSATGAVIGTSMASFEVAPFSNFNFANSALNSAGQPSSTSFTNNLTCAGISNFRRAKTDIARA